MRYESIIADFLTEGLFDDNIAVEVTAINCKQATLTPQDTEMQVSILLEIGICDDQVEWRETIQSLLRCYLNKKQLEANITTFTSAEELLKADWQNFHILFLDVVMGKKDGVQAAMQIRQKNPDVSLIFVSAFLDYATMGYQVKASAYLLKSQLPATLENAMNAVLVERQLNQEIIAIAVNGREILLPLHEITYIESWGRTAVFHGKTDFRTYMRFSDIETMLSGKGFLRVHRCYIVNLAHCTAIKNYRAILDTRETLPCSHQEYSNLIRSFMRWKGLKQ